MIEDWLIVLFRNALTCCQWTVPWSFTNASNPALDVRKARTGILLKVEPFVAFVLARNSDNFEILTGDLRNFNDWRVNHQLFGLKSTSLTKIMNKNWVISFLTDTFTNCNWTELWCRFVAIYFAFVLLEACACLLTEVLTVGVAFLRASHAFNINSGSRWLVIWTNCWTLWFMGVNA